MSNFYERIAETASRFGDRIAVERVGAAGTELTTYRELIDAAVGIGAWLSGSAGVRQGDRVAILAANDARWIAAYLGALRQGFVVVPLDTAYSVTQVQAILANSGARVLFTTARYLDTASAAIRHSGSATPPMLALLSGDAPSVPTYDELTAPGQAPPGIAVNAGDAAVMLYTSGTTADPKGVVLTHANLDAERVAVLQVVSASERDVVLGVLPLFHALAQMANLLLPLTIGARVVFLDTVSSTTLLDALQTKGITILACVPQFFYLIHQRVVGEVGRRGPLLRVAFRGLLAGNAVLRDTLGWNPGRRVFARVHQALGPRMRLLITGGSRFDPGIARDLYGLGVSLYNGYGLTETSGAAALVRAGDRFSTSVGPPLPGVEIQIDRSRDSGAQPRGPESDDRDQAVADPGDDSGEILIRGPIVMREYWQRPDATADVLRDGWFRTGDLGRLDADGRLYITGRIKEVIVLSSGKNLYPEEIEAHYRQSPFVKELCVLGLTRPGEPSAERLHAVVVPDEQVLRERGIVNLKELIRFELEGLSVQLPAHKRILSYDIWLEPLARTTTGKLKRHDIERKVKDQADIRTVDRALTDDERAWLAGDRHTDAMARIASHVHRSEVAPDANLELDLGLDSMERVELLAVLEAAAGTRVPASVRATVFTVRQLVEAVDAAPPASEGDRAADGQALPWDRVLAEPADPGLVHELSRPRYMRALAIFIALKAVLVLVRICVRVRIRGRERLGPAPFIVSPNHETYLDGFFVAAALPFRLFRQVFFVGAAEYFDAPIMAWGARAINIVPVDPDANLVNAMRAASTGLSLGKVLILFPEGERTIDGTLKPFRKGAAILASHLDVPIVPVALDGFFPFWPRGRSFVWSRLRPWRRPQVSVVFGDPLQVARGAYGSGTEALQQAVADLIGRTRDRTSDKGGRQ